MRFFKKTLSVLLISAVLITSFAPASYADYENNKFDEEIGIMQSTAEFFRFFTPLIKAYKLIFGSTFADINFEEGIAAELCGYICDNSGLDIIGILKSLPVRSSVLETGYKLTGEDAASIRKQLYEIRDNCYAEGNSTAGIIIHLIAAYISVIESVDVYTVPFGNDGTSRVAIKATYYDGDSEEIITDIYFSADGYAYGPDGAGIQLLGFDCSVYDLMIYATVNCWMRNFGFCYFYDFFCYTTPFFNYRTRRFKFDCDGKEWMVQVWKGNYLIANGAEVGIYNRDEEYFGTFYNCYDGVLPMTMKLSNGENVIYDIQKEHWWINGFKLGDELCDPDEMTVEFSIVMPDEKMAAALAEAINNHYRNDTSCELNGNTVVAVW